MRRAIAMIGLVLLLAAAACTMTAGRSEDLLSRDYQAMADSELQTYYRQVNDQVARVERAEGRTGRQEVGGENTLVDELRQRRNEVRRELSRRELLP